MSDRKYSVDEIDGLRRIMENKYLFGCYHFPPNFRGGSSRSYMEEDKIRAVEEWVRTAMLAGHVAEDFQGS